MENKLSDVVIFQDKNKKYTLSVKKEFIEKCPNPEQYGHTELLAKFKVYLFLHNEKNPSVILNGTKEFQFWQNGKYLEKENPELNTKLIKDFLSKAENSEYSAYKQEQV